MTMNPGKHDTFNQINITPLTDIFLVLLIIMMVIAPMFQKMDQNIEIPDINSGIVVKEDDIIVSINKEGQIYLNFNVVKRDELVNGMKELKDKTKIKSVILQADKQTKSKEVLYVMRAAQSAGMEKLTVAGETLSPAEAQRLQQQNNVETTG